MVSTHRIRDNQGVERERPKLWAVEWVKPNLKIDPDLPEDRTESTRAADMTPVPRVPTLERAFSAPSPAIGIPQPSVPATPADGSPLIPTQFDFDPFSPVNSPEPAFRRAAASAWMEQFRDTKARSVAHVREQFEDLLNTWCAGEVELGHLTIYLHETASVADEIRSFALAAPGLLAVDRWLTYLAGGPAEGRALRELHLGLAPAVSRQPPTNFLDMPISLALPWGLMGQLSGLQHLDVTAVGTNLEGVGELHASLQKLTQLRVFVLRDALLTPPGLRRLARALPPSLTDWAIFDSIIEKFGPADHEFAVLKVPPGLKSLDVKRERGRTVKKPVVSSSWLGPKERVLWPADVRALRFFGSERLGTSGFVNLPFNGLLRVLDLSYCGLAAVPSVWLKHIKGCTQLQHLSLRGNELVGPTADWRRPPVAEANRPKSLAWPRDLRTLDLGFIGLDDRNPAALPRPPDSLERLSLAGNPTLAYAGANLLFPANPANLILVDLRGTALSFTKKSTEAYPFDVQAAVWPAAPIIKFGTWGGHAECTGQYQRLRGYSAPAGHRGPAGPQVDPDMVV